MPRYRKKVEVEAVQLNWANWDAVCVLLGPTILEKHPVRHSPHYHDTCGEPGPEYLTQDVPSARNTRIGKEAAVHGDYIVKHASGNLSVYRPDRFKDLYEEIPDA